MGVGVYARGPGHFNDGAHDQSGKCEDGDHRGELSPPDRPVQSRAISAALEVANSSMLSTPLSRSSASLTSCAGMSSLADAAACTTCGCCARCRAQWTSCIIRSRMCAPLVEAGRPSIFPLAVSMTIDPKPTTGLWYRMSLTSVNFAVMQFDSLGASENLLVNEIGNYTGSVPIDAGGYLVITSDGKWTVAVSGG